MGWEKILKRRVLGTVMKVDGKNYRFPPPAYNEYLAVVERMKQNPKLRGRQNAIAVIAKKKIIKQFNLQPARF